MEKQGFESWAVVELMGHQRIAGKVSEAEIGGGKLLRVDVPEVNGKQALTKYFGTAAVYAITPVDEETARMVAAECGPQPVTEWSAREMMRRSDEQKALEPPQRTRRSGQGFADNDEDLEDDDFPA